LVVAEKIAKIWEVLSLLWNLIITRNNPGLIYPPPSTLPQELKSDPPWRAGESRCWRMS
jgi:hypothetical protein